MISDVIIPGDIPKYRDLFQSRGLKYQFFLLHPNYESALSRSKTRTCFSGITPEEWVKYFHDELSVLVLQENNDVVIFDNSEHTVEDSTEIIMRIFNDK